MNFMNEKIGKWLDVFGATASWACAVHCLALPLLITVLPLAGLSFLLSETSEIIFTVFSAAVAVMSFLPAYFNRHRKLRAAFLAVGGIALIVLTHLFFEENLALKIAFLVSGAVLLTAAHFVNRRLCRECAVCARDSNCRKN